MLGPPATRPESRLRWGASRPRDAVRAGIATSIYTPVFGRVGAVAAMRKRGDAREAFLTKKVHADWPTRGGAEGIIGNVLDRFVGVLASMKALRRGQGLG